MPENTGQAEPKPEPKPEVKPGEEPVQEHEERGKGSRKFVDYDNVSPQEAAVMLKRIRKRVGRIAKDLDVIMAILKYGANAQGAPQEGGGQENQGYRKYRRNYGYSKYGGRYGKGYKGSYGRQRRSENEDDVNYD
jgi:hypothetical protein